MQDQAPLIEKPTAIADLPLPPGSFGWPIVGETISFLLDPQFADKRQAKYGNIFKTQLIGRR